MNSILLCGINFLFLSAYLPLNRLISGGWKPVSRFDAYVPFIPSFVYPYLLAYIWIPILYIAYIFQPIQSQMQLTLATVIACLLGYICFYFLPTYVSCTRPSGKSPTARLLQFLHKIDSENNACPSMHVYMAVLLGYFSLTQHILLNILVLFAAFCVAIATVLIKRHYLLDVLGGLAVGFASIWISGLL